MELLEHEKNCEEVKRRLKEYCLPYAWLQQELAKRKVRASRNEISDVLTGHRKGRFAEYIAIMALYVLDDYESNYLNKTK